MSTLDYVVLSVLGLSVLISVLRGAAREVMALASWAGSALLALHFAPALAGLLPASLSNPALRLAAAFVAILVVSLLLFALVTLALAEVVKHSGLSPLDRSLGAVFGFLRGVVILVVLTLLAGLTALPNEPAWRGSLFAPPLEALAVYARTFLPPALGERIRYEHLAGPADG
jgi:membrane protein required for colicin V production